MAADSNGSEPYIADPDAESVAGGSQWNPLAAAALAGGVLAATAGAYLGTRALARRNGACEGKPVSSVMAAAITACDLNSKQSPTNKSGR